MLNTALSQKNLYCESCEDLEISPRHHEEPEIAIRELKMECPSCDYFLMGLGE